jgi:uncharacterized OB-fold protein
MDERPLNGASFQAFLQEHKLMAAQCDGCDALYMPPHPCCPHCGAGQSTMRWVELSGRGHLCAHTPVHIAPTAMIEAGYERENPYFAGIVQLEEGPSISAQILGVDATQPETIRIGTPVQTSVIEREQGGTRKIYLAFALEKDESKITPENR